jgi:hypothetical protein
MVVWDNPEELALIAQKTGLVASGWQQVGTNSKKIGTA